MKSTRVLIEIVVAFSIFGASQTIASESPADLVLRGGKIVTVDERRPIAESLAARGDRIVAVGSDSDVKPLIGPKTQVIDLAGKLAIPGFIEGHGHFTGLGQSRMMLDLKRAKSWDEIIEQVAEAARKAGPGEWIIGRGWHQEKWTRRPEPNVDGYPTHDRLSSLTPRNPVLLTHASGHMSFANGEAMRVAGVDSSTQDPPGGEVLKDRQENPIGVFRETAQGLISRAMSADRSAEGTQPRGATGRRDRVHRAIELATEECLANGVTSFQDAGSTFATIDVFKELATSGTLKLRLWVMVRDSNEAMARRLADYRTIGAGNNHLTVRAIKRAIDGALGPHGAWLLEPYHDLPESAGLNTASIESIRETAQLAVKHDYQLCVHAIGDRGNREVLDLFDDVFREHPLRESRRWRIEHAQHLHPDDIPRFAKLGVIASMQGIHCTSDAVYVRERLGPQRARDGAYVWRSLMKSGAVVTNGSDVPVEEISPIESFYASVTRRLNDGSDFYPEQRMSRAEALRSYTLNCAYAAFEEDLKGSLTSGKLADIAVLSKDIMSVPDDEIPGTEVLMTIVGGKVAYQRPGQELAQRPSGTSNTSNGTSQKANVSTSSPQGYQRPPKAITDILDVPPTPSVSISPTHQDMLLVERTNYPPIADLAAPMLRLAGRRINPETNGPHLAPQNVGLVLQSLADDSKRRVPLPNGARIGSPSWSPDGKQIAFTNTTDNAVELYILTVADASALRVADLRLNAAFGDSLQWMPDSRSLLVQSVVSSRGAPPGRPRQPAGPTIEESAGRAGPVRTYQDLLQDTHDESLFDYYCTSQLAIVDLASKTLSSVGKPGVFASVEPSPDGKHLLVVRLHRPYSYILPAERFPRLVEVWDRTGRVEFQVADLPLEDRIPIEGVPIGPRSVNWRPTEPAMLAWAEALDGGDPRRKVPHRDRVRMVAAPFQNDPAEIARTEHRFSGIIWGERDGLALIRDYDRDRRWTRTFQFNVNQPDQPANLLWERSINDRYADRGSPVMRPLANGQRVLWQHANSIFLDANGATPRGDRPFLDRFDLSTRESERLFQCDDASYETVVALVSDDGSHFITRHETPTDPPNFFLHRPSADRKRLTEFPDPMPLWRKIHKELVTYQRDDGVQLSFTLYLPPDRRPGQPLPTVVWAYPREFNDPGTAGQVTGSTNRFTTIGGISHLFFLTQGYAILDNATMPVVGDPETANNTYVEQIVSSARAAIDTASAMGVTDRTRVGVGGHSYGAFMTANLLAHSDLFRAGIARSGAYNRTLTPFGFQSERRTYWEAPEVYLKMSPFTVADRINEPILIMHGEADNNPGTFPIQSERLYQAIRGHGGVVRYVTLPHESHGYSARESVEHTLWEMITWFDRHLKSASHDSTGSKASPGQ